LIALGAALIEMDLVQVEEPRFLWASDVALAVLLFGGADPAHFVSVWWEKVAPF
jgi:hypothetical protein